MLNYVVIVVYVFCVLFDVCEVCSQLQCTVLFFVMFVVDAMKEVLSMCSFGCSSVKCVYCIMN